MPHQIPQMVDARKHKSNDSICSELGMWAIGGGGGGGGGGANYTFPCQATWTANWLIFDIYGSLSLSLTSCRSIARVIISRFLVT